MLLLDAVVVAALHLADRFQIKAALEEAGHKERCGCNLLRTLAAVAGEHLQGASVGDESVKMVHVIDLGGADAAQWVELLHLLATRPEGPSHLRLSAVHEHRDVLPHTTMALTKEVERLEAPFQFNPVVSSA